jgi:hypothetical protein
MPFTLYRARGVFRDTPSKQHGAAPLPRVNIVRVVHAPVIPLFAFNGRALIAGPEGTFRRCRRAAAVAVAVAEQTVSRGAAYGLCAGFCAVNA